MPASSKASRAGYAMAASAAVGWGTWSLFFRQDAMRGVAPALEGAVVLAVTFAAVSPWALGDRPKTPRPGSAWLGLAALGVCDALNALTYFWAMQRASIAVAVLSHSLAPLLIAGTAPLLLGEPGRRSTWLHIAIGLGGLALLLEPWHASAEGALAGAVLGGTSAIFYAGNVLLTKRLLAHFSPREIMGYHTPTGVLLLLAFVPRGGFAIDREQALILLAGGLLPGALAGMLFMRGLAVIPASHASVLALLEPLVAVALAALVWHEIPGVLGAAGALLILAAAWLVTRPEPARSEPAAEPDPRGSSAS